MKRTCVFFSLLFIAVVAYSQNKGYAKGDKLLNVGIGVNSYYNGGIPFGASFEVGVTDAISVGGNVDYLSYKYNNVGDFKFTALYIGARGSYHFNELLKIENEKFDIYGGLTLGYRVFSWKDDFGSNGLSNTYGSGVYLGAFAGGKYYFGSNIGGFLELGAIGSTNARIGVAFKF